jgi:hypothetical protein
VSLSSAWIAFRRLRGLAWLSMLILVFLFVVYLPTSLVTFACPAVVALVVGRIVIPVGFAAIASVIERAVMRRRARTANPA